MRVYLGTVQLESLDVSLDLPADDLYKAPEQQLVYVKITDFSGTIVSFRLGRQDYDAFRRKIMETEGYK